MYHYVVIKTAFFFFIAFLSLFSLLGVNATISPRERWNYQKKEDSIKHHTIKIKVKSQNRKPIKESANEDSEHVNSINKRNHEIIRDEGDSSPERPGSPRERW